MNYKPDQKKSLSQPKSPHRHQSHYLLPPFSWFPQVESKPWSSSSWACCAVQLWGAIGHLKVYWRSRKTLAHENGTEPDCTEFQDVLLRDPALVTILLPVIGGLFLSQLVSVHIIKYFDLLAERECLSFSLIIILTGCLLSDFWSPVLEDCCRHVRRARWRGTGHWCRYVWIFILFYLIAPDPFPHLQPPQPFFVIRRAKGIFHKNLYTLAK